MAVDVYQQQDGERRMASWRVFMIGALAFLLPFGLKTGQWWRNWQAQLDIKPACRYNLKALFVVARLCSIEDRYPFPPPFHIIKEFWVDSGRLVRVTPEIRKFLELPTLFEDTDTDFRGILLCARDPKYLLKMAKMAQGFPYEPSYRWRPDALTLAECPYCRLAITLDGRLRER